MSDTKDLQPESAIERAIERLAEAPRPAGLLYTTYALAKHSTFLMFITLLVGTYGVLTINISYIRDLKLGAIPGFEDLFLKISTLLGV